jgi:hypothetical protein
VLCLFVAAPKRQVSASVDGSPVRTRRISRTGSVDTLSPCESIASDDLMLDYERSEGSMFDCTAERYSMFQSCREVFSGDQLCKYGVTVTVSIIMAAHQP